MKSLVANRNWLRRRQGGIGGGGGMEHKFLDSQRARCGWVLGRWGAELSLHCLHSFAVQRRNSPQDSAQAGFSQPHEWMSSPPLAMVLQGANGLCILTAPGGQGFPVASAYPLLWIEGWWGCAANTVFLRSCLMGGRHSRQTRRKEGKKTNGQ